MKVKVKRIKEIQREIIFYHYYCGKCNQYLAGASEGSIDGQKYCFNCGDKIEV